MNHFSHLIRPHLRNFTPYSSARDENNFGQVMLDANENAFGSVAGDQWNRYPDPYQKSLKKAISGIKAVDEEKIFLGNGSDEPIDLLISTFCEPGKESIMICPPTYSMYEVAANIRNVNTVQIPLDNDFGLDIDQILSRLSEVKLIFICSPNNPTANSLDRNGILSIIKAHQGLVIIDEAYIDYSKEESFVKYVDHHHNLIVLQTFSKAWGLASYRLGLAIGHPDIVKILNAVKPPYNLSGLIQQKSLSALMNFQKKDLWVKDTLKERSKLEGELGYFECIEKVFPSDANFLLVKFKNSTSAMEVLKNEGVIVRDRSSVPGCENCLRITIGTREENNKLLTAIASIS